MLAVWDKTRDVRYTVYLLPSTKHSACLPIVNPRHPCLSSQRSSRTRAAAISGKTIAALRTSPARVLQPLALTARNGNRVTSSMALHNSPFIVHRSSCIVHGVPFIYRRGHRWDIGMGKRGHESMREQERSVRARGWRREKIQERYPAARANR